MPCYSNITETTITELQQLLNALNQLEVQIRKSTELVISTSAGTFSRAKVGDAFSFNGSKQQLAQIGSKYSELTVMEWASKNRMSFLSQVGSAITLLDRQTGGKLVVEAQPDGSVKCDASKMIGTNASILKGLQSLSKSLGGKLVVEKHVHSHYHTHTHSHTHNVKQS